MGRVGVWMVVTVPGQVVIVPERVAAVPEGVVTVSGEVVTVPELIICFCSALLLTFFLIAELCNRSLCRATWGKIESWFYSFKTQIKQLNLIGYV